jgi:hypothetical protein
MRFRVSIMISKIEFLNELGLVIQTITSIAPSNSNSDPQARDKITVAFVAITRFIFMLFSVI